MEAITVKIFVSDDCPKCPAAKELYSSLASSENIRGQVNVKQYNVGDTEGLTEAAMHMVMSTPTILVLDKMDRLIAEYRGDVPSVSKIELLLEGMEMVTNGEMEQHAPLR